MFTVSKQKRNLVGSSSNGTHWLKNSLIAVVRAGSKHGFQTRSARGRICKLCTEYKSCTVI